MTDTPAPRTNKDHLLRTKKRKRGRTVEQVQAAKKRRSVLQAQSALASRAMFSDSTLATLSGKHIPMFAGYGNHSLYGGSVLKVVSVGYNPANTDPNADVNGSSASMLVDKLLDDWEISETVDSGTALQIAQQCDTYHEHKNKHKYFALLEIAFKQFNTSYNPTPSQNCALHIDICKWATVSGWGRIPSNAKKELVESSTLYKDLCFLKPQVLFLGIHESKVAELLPMLGDLCSKPWNELISFKHENCKPTVIRWTIMKIPYARKTVIFQTTPARYPLSRIGIDNSKLLGEKIVEVFTENKIIWK